MTTLIEWTARQLADGAIIPGYTFNPWSGCTKVSPACKHCYAEAIDKRRFKGGHWGDGSPRREQSDAYWGAPAKWNTKASRLGVRLSVFCASMADILEKHPVPEVRAMQDAARARLFELVLATPMLDWLFLTKRIENAGELFPARWVSGPTARDQEAGFPSNVWVGVTCENGDYTDRVDALRKLRVFRRFVSYEPALGPVDWATVLAPCRCRSCGRNHDERPIDDACLTGGICHAAGFDPQIHWLIAGWESGPSARPTDPDWIRSARDACTTHGVNFFYKQAREGRKKVSLPVLDGRQHTDKPLSAPVFSRGTTA